MGFKRPDRSNPVGIPNEISRTPRSARCSDCISAKLTGPCVSPEPTRSTEGTNYRSALLATSDLRPVSLALICFRVAIIPHRLTPAPPRAFLGPFSSLLSGEGGSILNLNKDLGVLIRYQHGPTGPSGEHHVDETQSPNTGHINSHQGRAKPAPL